MSERTPSAGDPSVPAADETRPGGHQASGDAAQAPDRAPASASVGDAGDGPAARAGQPIGPIRHIESGDGPEPATPTGAPGPTPQEATPDDGMDDAVDAAAGAARADGHTARVRHWREQSRKRNAKAKRPWWVELPILIVIAFVLTFLIQTFIARVYYVPSGSMEQTLHGTTSGGDRILAFKLVYDFRDPEQGEVVVFKGPDTWAAEADIPGPSTWFGKAAQALGSVIGIAPANEKDFVKRVIAVGGQTVSCCDQQGRVQVDGHSLDEPYIYQPIDADLWAEPGFRCEAEPNDPTHYNSRRCFGPVTIPKGELWVMGDHRNDSSDSSYNCLGLTEQGMQQYQELRQGGCGRPIPVDDVIGKAVFIVMPPSRWGTVGSPDIMSSAAPVAGLARITIAPHPMPAAVPPVLGLLGAVGVRRLTGRTRWAHRHSSRSRRPAGARSRRRGR